MSVTPHADGRLETAALPTVPFGAARLEATLERGGRLLRLRLWGAGELARVTLEPPSGPWTVRPNLVESGPFRVALARSRPAVAISGSPARVKPSALPLRNLPLVPAKAAEERHPSGASIFELPWGVVAMRSSAQGTTIGAGADRAEALHAIDLSPAAVFAEAEAYASDCARLETDDALLGSMFAHSLHAAFAAVKADSAGNFAGLAAGPGYSLPPRTYYRDAYWTVQALLPVMPEAVRSTLELLTRGVHADGEAPSAVITPFALPAELRRAIHLHKGAAAADDEYEFDWWRDHFDSPLFFVLMLADYVAFTGDASPVEENWEKLLAILDRYAGFCAPGSDLPLKPYNERDWADNVFRSGLVTYDLGLYHGALRAVADFAEDRDPALAARLEARAARVREQAHAELWLPERGHFVDYSNAQYREEHLAIDTLTAVRFGLASHEQSGSMLAAVARNLETRNNRGQPYGDFGVMCCFPPYGNRADLTAKSAFPFRYHNGADWPYWDGLYAGLLLARDAGVWAASPEDSATASPTGAPAWRYPLLRWWEYSLEQGWVSPVEFFSPPFAPGAPLQAWSAMPAAAVMQEGFGLKPPFDRSGVSLIGPARLRGAGRPTADPR